MPRLVVCVHDITVVPKPIELSLVDILDKV